MLKSKFSLSRHFEYANEQITYHFWLCDYKLQIEATHSVTVLTEYSSRDSLYRETGWGKFSSRWNAECYAYPEIEGTFLINIHHI